MACITSRRGHNVLLWHDGIVLGQTSTAEVATGAFFWRPLEHALDVARLAASGAVHPAQRKTRFRVIKRSSTGRLRHHRAACEHQQQCHHPSDDTGRSGPL